MAKRKTLASKLGISQAAFSRKIEKVMHDNPSLTRRQAAGMASGILRPKKSRKVLDRGRRTS